MRQPSRVRQRHRRQAAIKQPACWSWELTQQALDAACRARTAKDAYYALLEWQLGRCAICAINSWLRLDHDHDTGLIRGLLCNSCNATEAGSDLPAWCNYRHVHPAFMLDLHVRYEVLSKC